MLTEQYICKLILNWYADIIPECWAVYKLVERDTFWSVIFINMDECYTFYINVSKFKLRETTRQYRIITTQQQYKEIITMLKEQVTSKIVNPNIN